MIEFKKYIHHGQDLEEAVLGACLLEKSAFGLTYGIVDAESFYFEAHRIVYSALKEMYDQNLPIEILTACEYLVAQKGISEIYGHNTAYFLCRLTNRVVSSANIVYHCHLIKEMWRRREIVKLRFSAPEDDGFDPYSNIDDINKKIAEILGGKSRNDWYDMSQLMYDLILHQHEMATGKKVLVTTGFKKIDQENGGFYNGQMIVIGARPGVGKSALMGKMALNMAQRQKKVGIISLEMSNNEIAGRLASLETGIDFRTVYRDIANDEALHKVFYDHISKKTVHLPIYVSDKTKVDINEIRAKATKLKASRGCDCLMIDYMQLIDSTTNKNYNREQEVAKISRGIKLMALEMEIPVIVLCQLNRAVTNRSAKDRYPKLSDLRESGAIEQDADVVMMLHRDYASGYEVDDQGNSTEFQADLLVPKWRNGSPCHLKLNFDPKKMKFSEEGMMAFKPVVEEKDEDPF